MMCECGHDESWHVDGGTAWCVECKCAVFKRTTSMRATLCVRCGHVRDNHSLLDRRCYVCDCAGWLEPPDTLVKKANYNPAPKCSCEHTWPRHFADTEDSEETPCTVTYCPCQRFDIQINQTNPPEEVSQ